MTIQKEPPGMWYAYCDHGGCSSRIEIDCDPDDSFSVAVRALREEHEWRVFPDKDGDWQHWCTDHAGESIRSVR